MLYEIAQQYDQGLRAYQPCKPAENRQAWEKLDEQWMKETFRTGEERLGFIWPNLTATQYLDFARTGNRERFQAPYYEKRKALGDLVLAECVEYRGRFLDDIVNGIFSICEESSWCTPAHNRSPEGGWLNLADSTSPIIDLFAAETGAILSMVLYLLETPLREFDPIISERIHYELDRRILTPFLEKHFWWMGGKGEKTNNWTVWCGQNVLITALLSEKDPGRRRMILEKVCKCADYFISDYGEDGCCDEGASYYRQSTLCLHQILEICNEVMNGAFESCFLNRKFQNMAMFLYHMHVEGNYYINFADCSAMPGPCGVREFLLAKRIGNQKLMWLAAKDVQEGGIRARACTMQKDMSIRLLHMLHITEMEEYDVAHAPEKEDVYYPSTGLMVVRDGTYTLAAKAGDNGDSHNHNDVGSVIVYKNGKPFLIDVGVEKYCRKTFSPQRYEIWTMQSAYHNLPVIDHKMQFAGEAYAAGDVKCCLQNCSLEMDLKGAYPEDSGLSFYRRNLSLIKGQEIRLKDRFAFEGHAEHEVILNLMIHRKPVSDERKREIHVRMGEKTGSIFLKKGKIKDIEEISIADVTLQRVWGNVIYRVLLIPEDQCFELIIH